jgi:hypothetical protein
MTGPVHARDAMDLVATTVYAVAVVVHGVFVEDLVDGRAPTRGSFSPNTSSRLRISKVDML